jgi:hypothetical protein
MYLRFGNYTHPIDNAGVSIESKPLTDAKGEVYANEEVWRVDFRLTNSTVDPKNLDSVVQGLVNAYQQPQASCYLLHDDLTETVHKMDSTNVVGGVRVTKPPNFLKYQNGEMVTYRTGRLAIAGTKFLAQDAAEVIDFKERIDTQQPGPEYKALTPNVGPSIMQRVSTNKPSTCTQTGTITYFGMYGPPAPPVFPQIPQSEPAKIGYTSPTKIGSGSTAGFYGFPVTYTYRWVWPISLQALPTRWAR